MKNRIRSNGAELGIDRTQPPSAESTGVLRNGGLVDVALLCGAVLALLFIIATPASGDEDFNTSFHDGVCYWWGSAEWVGVWGQSEGTARGVTSLWDGSCSKLRIKMQWANTSDNCVWASWTANPPAFSRSREGYHIDYSDADVLLGSTWYGFRVNHSGACTYS